MLMDGKAVGAGVDGTGVGFVVGGGGADGRRTLGNGVQGTYVRWEGAGAGWGYPLTLLEESMLVGSALSILFIVVAVSLSSRSAALDEPNPATTPIKVRRL